MKTQEFIQVMAIASFSMLSACAEWQSTPVVVDKHHGKAYRHMVKNQTLYPEHGKMYRPVDSLTGPKGESVVEAYRAPVTDLRKGKESTKFEIGDD